ncbi:MAG TPA: hypothetical protein VNS19_17625 [Acidimicrobiales bacterium]|nr:hypothetical protein [Acidimicrobiales bacterium]
MRAHRHDPTSDRRTEPGLAFDPDAGRLALGTESVVVPPGASNRVVLLAYVDLTAKRRGRSVAELVEVRQDDVAALAAALDLDAADLAGQIEDVLGATRAEAVRLVSRLRESRLIGGITKAATGAAVAGALLAGAGAVTAGARPGPAPATPAAAVTTTSAVDPAITTTTDMTAAGGWQSEDVPVVDGPLTVDENGVGLIPPVTEEASGAVLVPPTSVDREDPAGS